MNIFKHYKGRQYVGLIEGRTAAGEKFQIYINQHDFFKNDEFSYPMIAEHTETGEQYKVHADGLMEKVLLVGQLEGVKPVRGIVWARPYDMFHGLNDDGEKRFVCVT